MTETRLKREDRDFDRMLPLIVHIAHENWKRRGKRNRWGFSKNEYITEVMTAAYIEFRRLIDSGRSGSAFATPIAEVACRNVNTGRALDPNHGRADALDHARSIHQERRGDEGTQEELGTKPVKIFKYIGGNGGRVGKSSKRTPKRPAEIPASSERPNWQDLLTADGRLNPAENAALRTDFADYFATLNERLRTIGKLLAVGYQKRRIAALLGISESRVIAAQYQLRRVWNSRQ